MRTPEKTPIKTTYFMSPSSDISILCQTTISAQANKHRLFAADGSIVCVELEECLGEEVKSSNRFF